jgi:predicted HTH domain antitoxin
MLVEISDEIIASSHLTIEEVRLGLAIWLFQEKKVSLGKCAKVAGMHKMIFQKELAKRKIAIHYTEEDFKRDLKSVNQLP